MLGNGTRHYKCVAITIGYQDDQMWRTEIHRYETNEPSIIMLGHPGGLGPMYAVDGKLLALNPGQRFIAELEACILIYCSIVYDSKRGRWYTNSLLIINGG